MNFPPGSGTATPKTRVNHVKKIRDNLKHSIQSLKNDISILESEVSNLNQSIKTNKNEIKNKQQDLENYSNDLEKLENKTQNLNLEYSYTAETILRYRKMAQIAGPMPMLHDFHQEIEDLRNEIIAMEKEIIECKNQTLLVQKISQAQIRREALIQNDARLLDKLNSLTVQLSILQYAGDKKLITDSEYIIEKQLTSEELRNKLQGILRKRQIEQPIKANEPDPNSNISINSSLEEKLFHDENDPIYKEIDSISSSLDGLRAKLNFYLKCDRKLDELERNKRRKLDSLDKLDDIVNKYKKEFETWTKKRNEFVKNDEFLQAQIDLMTEDEHPSPQALNDFLKDKQKEYKDIKEKRAQVASEYKHITIDNIDTKTSPWPNRINQINIEINALHKLKNEIIRRQQAYTKLNSLHGIRQILQMERSIQKAESEVDEIVMKLSKVRRRKKEVNKQINKSLASLANLGVTPPACPFRHTNVILD